MIAEKEEWTRFLDQWKWEYMVSLILPQKMPIESVYRVVQRSFIRPLSQLVETQVYAVGIVNTYRTNHIHLGIASGNGSLDTINRQRVLQYGLWPRDKISIELVWTSGGVSNYMARNLTLNKPDHYDVLFFNKRMLKKVQGSTPNLKGAEGDYTG